MNFKTGANIILIDNKPPLADLLAISGRRMIVAGSNQSHKLSPEDIKRLTGADSLTSRRVAA